MKILVLLSRFPFPLDKGDKLRAFQQIRCLSEVHELHLYCIDQNPVSSEQIKALKKYCQSIHCFRISKIQAYLRILSRFLCPEPLQTHFFYTPRSAADFRLYLQNKHFDHVVCQLTRMAPYLKDYTGPCTLDYQDAFSLGMSRRAKVSSWPLSRLFQLEAKRLQRWENKLFDRFDHHWIISETDRQAIHHPKRSQILIVRNGVDTHYFAPQNSKKQYDLVFVGNMSYPPNIMAAEYLVNQILTPLNKAFPGVRVLIAGAAPHAQVRRLASEHVHIWSNPSDIRCAYGQAHVFVAPMMIGSGLQNKLLEAMAMGIPCITTSLANASLGAEVGHTLLIADQPETWVENIVNWLKHPEQATPLAQEARTWVCQNFDWYAPLKPWLNLISASSNGRS